MSRRPRWWIVTLDGERIRRARRRSGLSQAGLAYAAGVSPATVGRLERQVRPACHFATRARIAAALGAHPQAITSPDGMSTSGGSGPDGSGLTCSRVFPAQADQAGQARAFLRRVLAGCPLADDVVLICSELAANAIRHSASALPGGRFTVRAEIRDGDYAWIEVEDQGGPWTPLRLGPESGRGLVVVDEVASCWDIRGDDTGRIVCARLDWSRRGSSAGRSMIAHERPRADDMLPAHV